MIKKKVCVDCGDPKALALFFRDARQKDGRTRVCKRCQIKRNRKSRGTWGL
jgi:hypothetical protein